MPDEHQQVQNHERLFSLEKDFKRLHADDARAYPLDSLIEKYDLNLEWIEANIKSIPPKELVQNPELRTHEMCFRTNVLPALYKRPIMIDSDHLHGMKVLNWHYISTKYALGR